MKFYPIRALGSASAIAGHSPVHVPKEVRAECCVCKLESNIHDLLKKTEEGQQQLSRSLGIALNKIESHTHRRKWLCGCDGNGCTLYAHHIRWPSTLFIHNMEPFQGLTCYEICHHPATKGLWKCNPKHAGFVARGSVQKSGQDSNEREMRRELFGEESGIEDSNSDVGKVAAVPRAYNPCTGHPVFVTLREKYGLTAIRRAERNVAAVDYTEEDDAEEDE